MTPLTDEGRRKLLLTINIVGNLGLLCYFKYANFFLDSLRQSLAAAGLSASFGRLDVLLPIGISFYTFEAINYMVDVYRGHVKAARSLPRLRRPRRRDHAVHVSPDRAFSHRGRSIANPIVRARARRAAAAPRAASR